MKGKKKKEEDTSSETPEKKPAPGGRLSGMIESMQKRGSPVNAHKVATAYFDSFRKERNLPEEPAAREDREPGEITAVDTGDIDDVPTAVDSAVKKKPSEKRSLREVSKTGAASKGQDPMLTPSEQKVYSAIYKECGGGGSEGLRLGLKELRGLTGLSDKTIRVAVHSLGEKLCIEIAEPSLGIYGRKYRVFGPEEVEKRRAAGGLVIDPVTKRVLSRTTPVITAVSNTVHNAVNLEMGTRVSTAVITPVDNLERKEAVSFLYEKYTGKKWDVRDDAFYETVSSVDAGVMETAILLGVLKGEDFAGGAGDIGPLLGQLGTQQPAGYLENLREVWGRLKERAGEG